MENNIYFDLYEYRTDAMVDELEFFSLRFPSKLLDNLTVFAEKTHTWIDPYEQKRIFQTKYPMNRYFVLQRKR